MIVTRLLYNVKSSMRMFHSHTEKQEAERTDGAGAVGAAVRCALGATLQLRTAARNEEPLGSLRGVVVVQKV
ncbi:hypothetical protein EYF80_008830 [Liparis tanakae]|uniref:Uncharacterized protein n=1 Tax=Liparis tanakae TaxID=230148 RepID=A0A4Z2ISF8_9TELE|nr:hypothetical protein EYF80_008830 [Liparis tanakae]